MLLRFEPEPDLLVPERAWGAAGAAAAAAVLSGTSNLRGATPPFALSSFAIATEVTLDMLTSTCLMLYCSGCNGVFGYACSSTGLSCECWLRMRMRGITRPGSSSNVKLDSSPNAFLRSSATLLRSKAYRSRNRSFA